MKDFICYAWDCLPKRWFSVTETFILMDEALVPARSYLSFLGNPVFILSFRKLK